MTAVPVKKYTLEEYFEFDREAEGNFEYFEGEIIEMSGVSANHARIENRLGRLFGKPADKKGCEVFPANLRIRVPAMPPYRYPDLSVVCGGAVFEKISGLDCLVNPILIVEVLSDSTEKFDRGEKFRQYKLIETFREYLLIEQNGANVTLFQKHNERFWLQSDYAAGESLCITTLDFELSVDEIYQGVDFQSNQ